MAKQKLTFDEALERINEERSIDANNVQAREVNYWASRDIQTVGA